MWLLTARTTPARAQQLIEAGILEPCPHDEVEGFIIVFEVLELFKQRYRIIQETRLANKHMPDAGDVSFTALMQRRQLVHKGDFAVERDFMSYYHQFTFSEAVRRFNCVRVRHEDGSTHLYRLCVGPTGQKHMVYVACMTTDLLLAFDKMSAALDTQIDNILFVGDVASLKSDLTTFRARCAQADVTINDDTDDLDSIIQSELTWCGMVLNFEHKTVRLAEKSRIKFQASLDGIEDWSWSGFAAHMGLLWWSFQVLRMPVCNFYNLLRFTSSVSQKMQAADDKHWHHKAKIDPSALKDLLAWTTIALANEPVAVPARKAPEVFVLVDASSHGWGYVAYDTITGKVYQYGEKWDPAFAARSGSRLGKSTYTEPWGLLNTKEHLIKAIERDSPSFFFGSDNAPTVYVFQKRFSSRSYDMNDAVAHDEKHFSKYQCDYVHVEGKKNVLADAKSRGLSLNDSAFFGDSDIVESLRRLLGVLPAESSRVMTTGAGKGETDVFPHHLQNNERNTSSGVENE